ncbi:hypothetical protein, partial [Rothia kristinae]
RGRGGWESVRSKAVSPSGPGDRPPRRHTGPRKKGEEPGPHRAPGPARGHARRAGATGHGRHVILPGVDGAGLPVLAAQQVAAEIRALAGCLPGRRAYTPHPWRL